MKNILLICLIPVLLWSCDNNHFISDRTYRKKVEAQFDKVKKLAANRDEQLFSVFDQKISLKEKEALEFLYAYMPLSDLADYDGDFYLQNVRASFAAKDTFSWGKSVPEDIFRHFVLPVRVNNENLDSSRVVFFDELKDRIRNMSMKEAALEINHWCHEKVTYKGSDARTSSPLATVKNAYGRCGEESTFAVAAYRAACIPARQCYTPRWAHVDDNHAWVEVWVEGKWHYLGACEPEPDLDMGWFSGPAKRAMLVSTNVFGDYSGPEDVLLKDERFTRINVLANYTNTKRIYVSVKSEDNQPVDSAKVEFQLYNYSEFYPLTKSYTDKNGNCSFLTGYGSLIIHAAKNDIYDYKNVVIGNTDTVRLVFRYRGAEKDNFSGITDMDLPVPPVQEIKNTVSDSARNENMKRFAFEDKIRGNYEKTFIDSTKSYRLAATLEMNGDSLWQILKTSRGNYRDIIDFVSSVPENRKHLIFPLLNALSEKDLHDITPDVLYDQMNAAGRTGSFDDGDIYFRYILNPRINNEFLRPYQTKFQEAFEENFINDAKKNPELIKEWINKNIRIDTKGNYGRAPITPAGVYDLRVSDPASRDIFLVALCRSFSIPSRLEPSSSIPQYYSDGKWKDVNFEKADARGERGFIILDYKGSIRPEYYINFTVERLNDGFYRSLDYETDTTLRHFPVKLEVLPGSYMIVTGKRLEDGSVLAHLDHFSVSAGKETGRTLSFRDRPAESLNVFKLNADFIQKIGRTIKPGKKGTVIAWIEPEKEPSRHLISEISERKSDFEKWNDPVVFIFSSEREMKLFAEKNSSLMPDNLITMIGDKSAIGNVSAITSENYPELPLVIYLSDKKLKVVSAGYSIGTGENLLKTINNPL